MAARNHIVPIFLPHWGCPYQCVYCDQTVIAAHEGLLEIGGLLAEALEKVPPSAYPVEVAFYGGTFTALPLKTQALLLDQVQEFMALGQVGSIRLSTHPACLEEKSLELLVQKGVETVELGVQSLQPEVLRHSGRDYSPDSVAKGVTQLRRYGFNVGIQLMPGLPGDSLEKTLDTVKKVIRLAPDFVRVYPTLVINHTPLAEMWRSGQYTALTLNEGIEWCKEISKLFYEAHIPIIRMGLHATPELEAQVLAGPYHPAFKALVDSALTFEKIEALITNYGGELVIYCNPREVSRVRGDKNMNISKLMQRFGFSNVRVVADSEMAMQEYKVEPGEK
jgi:histone acetyltransferase (RNA polymerase elongator complex component)